MWNKCIDLKSFNLNLKFTQKTGNTMFKSFENNGLE